MERLPQRCDGEAPATEQPGRRRTGPPGTSLQPPRHLQEPRIAAELKRGDFSRWQQGRGYCVQEEFIAGEPARIFLFRISERWHVGYKTLSDYFVYHDTPGLLCSRIYWHHVVGRLDTFRTSDTGVRVTFHPLDVTGRRAAFDAISSTTPIVHPFATHDESGLEETSPPDGWPVTEERADSLNVAEEHLRRYTRDLFGPLLSDATESITAYDPACSTGHFLADFAGINPARIRTVGQDLSREMVDYAARRLDEVHVGDAFDPAPAPGTVDVLFCRFLNSEVVSTRRAREILPRLVATVRDGGTVVLLGHSPVLLDVFDLENVGLRVAQTTARQDDYVFQYYVCHKAA
ncbi:class I SAM-dependent methyltransferase [Streptomyces sp. TR02-1]|uniref:class I SAM-dependent methyltransferase n=1 Tax=Streptomyces sp. TR02-1 TaxID=3385977 RepID=UPI0039A1C4A8